ncbi:MAG: hypothetical protein ACRDBP_12715, partial [Luteolibacter sp.]
SLSFSVADSSEVCLAAIGMFRVARELTSSRGPDKKKDVRSNKNQPRGANFVRFGRQFAHRPAA